MYKIHKIGGACIINNDIHAIVIMEDYSSAATDRLADFDVLSKKRRKVCAIHIGGVYIECLLKAMLCCANNVTEVENRSNRWIINEVEIYRPSHSLTTGPLRDYLPSIYEDMPEDVLHSLEYIAYPNDIDYISYRYVSSATVSDEEYDEWYCNFINVFDYLQEKKREL